MTAGEYPRVPAANPTLIPALRSSSTASRRRACGEEWGVSGMSRQWTSWPYEAFRSTAPRFLNPSDWSCSTTGLEGSASGIERHLVFYYAGGRIYGDDLYDVVDVGNDEVFEVFVR
ncbi:MAG: hypothetical protein ACI8RZ_005510 [Myxococcota bacterium]|jgi:hypothetical protein